MRKRISLTVVAALTVAGLSATAPAANAHGGVVSESVSNVVASTTGTTNGSLFVAEKLSTTGAAVVGSGVTTSVANTARSLGLLAKSTSSGVAQTATALTGAQISLYAPITATTVAFTASAGSFSVSSGQAATGGTAAYNQTRTVLLLTGTTATTVGTVWVAPSTAGTYTISLYYHGNGAVPTTSTPAGTLAASLLVTVVTASVASTYSAADSFCAATNAGGNIAITSNTDGTLATANGGSMWINIALKDAYGNALDAGNIVATATNGALLNYGNGVAAPVAGTASTVVAYDGGSGDVVRVDQGTADVPLSTTVTITYNGTAICTKTVGFAGAPAKVAVTVVETQGLSMSAGKTDFLADGYARTGLFTVLLTDAAGNQVAAGANSAEGRTSAIGTFSVNSASLAGQTIVSTLSVTSAATQTSTTLPGRVSTGTYTCGATAGEVKTAKLDFTIAATGKVITSDAFTIRCADAPSSYTASFDKASYNQGDLAILTVKFLDSKGNAANSVSGTGGWTSVTPMLTNVSTTGAAAGLGTTGTKTYTYTVGTASGMTAGTYTSIIDFTTLTGAGTAVKATPTYKLSSGGDTTTNADVLKSIVALIASINKQIQALQKLILKK